MKQLIIMCIMTVATLFLTQWQSNRLPTHVSQLLHYVGDSTSTQSTPYLTDTALIKKGYDLIHFGKTSSSKPISKHFKCTSCHNTKKEVDDIKFANSPKHQLAYASKNNLPFLQGSSFYGIVNRETWYNDDYKTKYGALVDSARHDLGASIQLCAQVCSQGRILESWEERAILAYFWSLQLKTSDLNLPQSLIDSLLQHPSTVSPDRIKEFYTQTSPSHFITPDEERPLLSALIGNIENGKKLFDLSCMQCHNRGGVSLYTLNDTKLLKKMFKKQLGTYSNHDLYQIIRWGTYAIAGHKPYMPLYPVEKMSHQQIKDLVTYLTTP